jgi:hypothetical protein
VDQFFGPFWRQSWVPPLQWRKLILVEGRYALPITRHDLYVSAPGPLGTTVIVNFPFKPIANRIDTLDSFLEYQLPPGYNEEPINEMKATCDKSAQCGGIQIKCVGVGRPYPMSFRRVPLREIKASGKSFSWTYDMFQNRSRAHARRFFVAR